MFHINKHILLSLIGLVLISEINISAFAITRSLPSDAALEQVLYHPIKNEAGAYLDRMKTVYNSLQGGSDIVYQPLVALNKDLEVVPLGIESWEVGDDGLNWTFRLIKELMWSDGTPLTAHDYVFALHRAVEKGYDFGWYWSSAAGIKNWEKVEKGELPLEELGIRALDDYTLVIITEIPKPYLLGILRQLYPVPRHAVNAHGDEYATQAETMVGNGPFMVTEWVRGSHLTLVQNPYYNGLWQPYLEEIILKYGTFEPETGFPAYLNNEVHRSDLNAGQLAFAKANIPDQLHSWPMFRIFYLSFDTTKPPFDDVRVRQAFSHTLNREELCDTVLKDLAIPEYSILMTGFPGYDARKAKELSGFDPTLARKLLSEAGYPNGKGFPELELWLRHESKFAAWQIPAATYMQAQFKEVLGVDIVPRLIEAKIYTDSLNKHTHNLFMATYVFDYLDPSNFMDLFLTGGRHAWSNTDYDRLVREADAQQDWGDRLKNYREAENILVKEAPAVFAFQAVSNAVWKPFLKGEGIEPNKKGITSWNDIMYSYIFSHVYIGKH